MQKKTIILIITTSLVVFLIILLSYYFLLKDNTAQTGEENGGFFSFFPFGGGNDGTGENPGTTEPTPEENIPIENYEQKLRLISREPVAGMGLVEAKAGTILRYIEKSTGHIYEVELFSPNRYRVSNATIPVVYNSLWSESNTSILATYLADDNTTVDIYGLTMGGVGTTTESTVSAVKFPPGIANASVFGNSVFYLQKTDSGSVGYTTNFESGGKKQVWNSPIKELESQYVSTRTVALTTKPDSSSTGFLYFVDTNNGGVRAILRNIFGLVTLVSPDANFVLYSENGNSTVSYLYDIKNTFSKNVSPVTLPEKCVFSKKTTTLFYCGVPRNSLSGGTLISWYKGTTYLADDVWKYDPNTSSTMITNLNQESGDFLDVIKPMLSPNERYFVFINKKDGSLWSLDLTK